MRWWVWSAAALLLLCAAPRPTAGAAVLSDRLLRRLRADAGPLDPAGGAAGARPYLRAYAAALRRHGVRRPEQVRALVQRRADLLPAAVSEPSALAALLAAWDGGAADGSGVVTDSLDGLVRELVQAAADRLARGEDARTAAESGVSTGSPSPRGILSVTQTDRAATYIIQPDRPAGVKTERLVLGSPPRPPADGEEGVQVPAAGGGGPLRSGPGVMTGQSAADWVSERPTDVVITTGDADLRSPGVGDEHATVNSVSDTTELVNQSHGVTLSGSDLQEGTPVVYASEDSSAITDRVSDVESSTEGSSFSTGGSSHTVVPVSVPMTVLGITMPIGDAADDFRIVPVTPASNPAADTAVTAPPVEPAAGGAEARDAMRDQPVITADLHAFLERFEQRQRDRRLGVTGRPSQKGQTAGGASAAAGTTANVLGALESSGSFGSSEVSGAPGSSTEKDEAVVTRGDEFESQWSASQAASGAAAAAAPPSKSYPADPWELYSSLFRPGRDGAETIETSTERSATPPAVPVTEPPPPPPRPPPKAALGSLAELLVPLLDTFERMKGSTQRPPQRSTTVSAPEDGWQRPEAALGRFPLLPPPPGPPDDRPATSDQQRDRPEHLPATSDEQASQAVDAGSLSHRLGLLELGPTTPPNQPRPAAGLNLADRLTRGRPGSGASRPWLGLPIGQQNSQTGDRRPSQPTSRHPGPSTGHHPDQPLSRHPNQQFDRHPGQQADHHPGQPMNRHPGQSMNRHPDQSVIHGPDSQFAHRLGQRPFYESGRNPLLAGIVEPHMQQEVHRFSTMDLHRLRGGGGGRVPVVSLQLPDVLAGLRHRRPALQPRPPPLPPRRPAEKVPPIVTKRLTTPPPVTESVTETVTEWVTPRVTTPVTPETPRVTTPVTPPVTPRVTTPPPPPVASPVAPSEAPRVTFPVTPRVTSPALGGDLVAAADGGGEATLRPYPGSDGPPGAVSRLTTTESSLEALGAIISGILGTASPELDDWPPVDSVVEQAVDGVVGDTGVDVWNTYGRVDGGAEGRLASVIDKERPSLQHHDLADDRHHTGLAELDGLLSGAGSGLDEWGLSGSDPGLRGRVVGGGSNSVVTDHGTDIPSPSDSDLATAVPEQETSVEAAEGGAAAAARLNSRDIAYILIGTTAGVIVLCVTLVAVTVRCRRGGRLYALMARLLRTDYRQGLESHTGTSPDELTPTPTPTPTPALAPAPPTRPPPPPVGLATHKLGSWFNGRSETLGSETFHSKLALPMPYASQAAPPAQARQPRPHGYNLRQLVNGLTTQLLSSSSSGAGSVVNTSDFDDTPKSRRAGRDGGDDGSDAEGAVRGSYLFGGLMSPPKVQRKGRGASGESPRAGSGRRRHRSESRARGSRVRDSKRSQSQPLSPEQTSRRSQSSRRSGARAHGSGQGGRRSHSQPRTPERDRRLTRPRVRSSERDSWRGAARVRSPHPRRRRGSPDYRRRRRSEHSERQRERQRERDREDRRNGRLPRWPPQPDEGSSHGSGSPVEWSSNDERLI